MALPALVFLALAAFAAALFGLPGAGRAAQLHVVFAVGAMPLIFGAMEHFIPVLTRTRKPPAPLAAIPFAGLAAGALIVVALADRHRLWAQHTAALLGAIAAATLLIWSRRRRASMLGRAHPCLAWYEAALASLVLALAAILATPVWPEQTFALQRAHLHLNTLGFVGMTALGTLAVLVPTVVGRPDAEAGTRLQRDLPWAAIGTLLVAGGAAWHVPTALIGAVLYAVAPVRLGTRWLRLYRAEIVSLHGATPLLAAALVGLAISIVYGTAMLATPDVVPTAAFVSGFLLPLVTGAAGQLLPVWLRPGVQGAWHADLRARLGRYGGVRALLFGVAGVATGAGFSWGWALATFALLWFMVQVAAGLARARTAKPAP